MAEDRSLPPEFASYPRDMRGYGPLAPHPRWPGEARLALQFGSGFGQCGEHGLGESVSAAGRQQGVDVALGGFAGDRA